MGLPLEIHKELFEEESLVFFISIVNIINRTKQVKWIDISVTVQWTVDLLVFCLQQFWSNLDLTGMKINEFSKLKRFSIVLYSDAK